MKCARCNTPLDDCVMVCSQCGAVVGMNYARGPGAAGYGVAPKPAPPALGAVPRTGTSKRLTERVRDLMTSPRAEWSAIAAEPVRAIDVWLGYVVPLALIGPIALAVAQVAFGSSFPLVGVVKATLVNGVAAALLAFAFSLAQVAVLSWAVRALAPKFQAVPDRLAALEVVAYSMTPLWLAGIVHLVPVLAFVWIFAAAYAFVLCLFGLRALMRCTPPQALGYALATLGIGFALWVVAGALVTALVGFGPVMFD
jgi:hypothetical protein